MSYIPRVLFLSDAFLFLAPSGSGAKSRSFDPFRQALMDTLAQSAELLVVKTNDVYRDNSLQPHYAESEARLIEAIKGFQPDWIISLNCAGLTSAVRQACQRPDGSDIPALCWYLDSYKRINPQLQKFKPSDQLFLTGKGDYQAHFIQHYGASANQVHTLPFCTNPDIFCPPLHHPPQRELDVSFVGTCFRGHHLNQWLSLVAAGPDANLPVFLKHYEAHKADYQYDLIRNLDNDGFDWSFLTDEQRESYRERLLPILDDQLSAEIRLSMLAAMAEFNLAIYGEPDDGWLNAIGLVDSRLFRAYRFQPIATPQALAALYHRSKIALNVPHHQASTHSLPIRVFDIMASGALLLTPASTVDALAQIGYEQNVDFVAGASPGQMRDLAAYYLQHPQERDAIARSAQEKVLQHHTLQVVVNQLHALAKTLVPVQASRPSQASAGLTLFQLPAEWMPLNAKSASKAKKTGSKLKRLIYTKLSARWRLLLALERLGTPVSG